MSTRTFNPPSYHTQLADRTRTLVDDLQFLGLLNRKGADQITALLDRAEQAEITGNRSNNAAATLANRIVSGELSLDDLPSAATSVPQHELIVEAAEAVYSATVLEAYESVRAAVGGAAKAAKAMNDELAAITDAALKIEPTLRDVHDPGTAIGRGAVEEWRVAAALDARYRDVLDIRNRLRAAGAIPEPPAAALEWWEYRKPRDTYYWGQYNKTDDGRDMFFKMVLALPYVPASAEEAEATRRAHEAELAAR
ncbi:hypothetical protein [Rhodococcus sp. NPDC004095]